MGCQLRLTWGEQAFLHFCSPQSHAATYNTTHLPTQPMKKYLKKMDSIFFSASTLATCFLHWLCQSCLKSALETEPILLYAAATAFSKAASFFPFFILSFSNLAQEAFVYSNGSQPVGYNLLGEGSNVLSQGLPKTIRKHYNSEQ